MASKVQSNAVDSDVVKTINQEELFKGSLDAASGQTATGATLLAFKPNLPGSDPATVELIRRTLEGIYNAPSATGVGQGLSAAQLAQRAAQFGKILGSLSGTILSIIGYSV